jgi:hypothetical protein
MRQSNAEKKYRNHYCLTANHRIYGDVLGVSIGNSCLVGIPALAKPTAPTNMTAVRMIQSRFFNEGIRPLFSSGMKSYCAGGLGSEWAALGAAGAKAKIF